MLWHWRNGFELLPYVASVRAMRARWKKKTETRRLDDLIPVRCDII